MPVRTVRPQALSAAKAKAKAKAAPRPSRQWARARLMPAAAAGAGAAPPRSGQGAPRSPARFPTMNTSGRVRQVHFVMAGNKIMAAWTWWRNNWYKANFNQNQVEWQLKNDEAWQQTLLPGAAAGGGGPHR
jgi:hypothetical protein